MNKPILVFLFPNFESFQHQCLFQIFGAERVFESLRTSLQKNSNWSEDFAVFYDHQCCSTRPDSCADYKTDYKVQAPNRKTPGKLCQGGKTGYAQGVFVVSAYKATSSTKLTSLTWLPARSSRTGIRSRSSLSWASENQLLIGTACCGWKMYEVGELSIMIVSFKSRPICERS
jgi:hypothetical protein